MATLRMIKSSGHRVNKFATICRLDVSNAGTMKNGYAMYTDKEDAEKVDQDVAFFIKTSSIITTAHHFLVLIFFITVGSVDPILISHWESPEFLLKPSGHDFYWTIIFTVVLGIHSLTLLLYRAHNIATIEKKNKSEKEESSV